MERRLQNFIDERDFYSAQQLIISHAQKLERSGKAAEGRRFLFQGTEKLFEAKAPVATLFDVVNKYLTLGSGEGTSSDETTIGPEVLKLLRISLSTSGVPEKLDSFWTEVAEFACEVTSAHEVVSLLLETDLGLEETMEFVLKVCPDEPTVFTVVVDRLSAGSFLYACLVLLRLKCFSSTSMLLKSYSDRQALNVNKIMVKKLQLYEETQLECRAINLITLMLELFCREPRPRDLFVQLQVRYSDIIKSEQIKKAYNELRESAWPSSKATSMPTNPLASMLQNLMTN